MKLTKTKLNINCIIFKIVNYYIFNMSYIGHILFIISYEIFAYTSLNYNFIVFVKQIFDNNNIRKKIYIAFIKKNFSGSDINKWNITNNDKKMTK